MSTSKAFAYNPSLSPIDGTESFDSLVVGVDSLDFSQNPGGIKWWGGPDEDLAYVIANVRPGGQPVPAGVTGGPAYVGFWKSKQLTAQSFLNMSNHIGAQNGQAPFATTSDAVTWLNANGYYTSYGASTPPALKLTFGLAFPVGDATDVTLWNTLLGSSFASCTVNGLTVSLFGSPGFTLLDSCLFDSGIISIIDEASFVLGGQSNCLAYNTQLATVSLPAATTIGNNSFQNAGFLISNITFYLPSCTQLGSTVLSNSVFLGVAGKTITLTVPAILMTCNSGNPDGDIQYLQANNTVTVNIPT